MYQGKLAFAVKVDGKILHERNETVYLPFGAEYSLLIKNLNNRRVCVNIQIDGKNIADGGLVVNANSTVDLERFIENGQLDRGHKLKFIERTAKVEQHRGVGIEDGLIRVEFEFEEPPKPLQTITTWSGGLHNGGLYGGGPVFNTVSGSNNIYTNSSTSFGLSSADLIGSASLSAGEGTRSAGPQYTAKLAGQRSLVRPVNDSGITVHGGLSEQKFRSVEFTGDGKKEVMVMKLLGQVAEQKIEQPVTAKTKLTCSTCGQLNRSRANFCSGCGTGLEMWPGAKAIHSRFQIGDWVICKGYKHQVKSVKFTEGKVMYGLAFFDNLEGEVIEHPSEDVYGLRDFEKAAITNMGVR